MQDADLRKLCADAESEILDRGAGLAVLGVTTTALELVRHLTAVGLHDSIEGIYGKRSGPRWISAIEVRSFEELARTRPNTLVVAADEEKEDLLEAALPYLHGNPRVLVAGYGHLAFRDAEFHDLLAGLLVPSIANGYPACLVHIYQCLVNAARLGLQGTISEFGTFKGGTAVFMAKVARRLSMNWPVYSFDSFTGFPPRRSPLDMYRHPGAEFSDIEAVRNYTSSYGITSVEGDIVETAPSEPARDHVLAFIDTDNYSSGMAAIDAVRNNILPGGAIVFDHFTGVDRFRYTLGERIAAKTLLDDPRYFNLHGTGVFLRQGDR